MKRQVVDSILNASPGTIANLNSSFQHKTDLDNPDLTASITSKISITSKQRVNTKTRKSSVLGTSVSSQRHVNNISFDDYSEISNTNRENNNNNNDTISTCGSESGRYTATDNTTSPVTSETTADKADTETTEANADTNTDTNTDINKPSDRSKSLEDTLLSINRTTSMSSIDYEDEIDKLRQEILSQKLPQSKLKHSLTEGHLNNIITPKVKIKLHNSSVLSNPDQRLADSSLTISKSFDVKIKDLEHSLRTIENATSNMDAYVKGMTSVYQDDEDDKLCNESQDDEDFFGDEKQRTIVREQQQQQPTVIESVYDDTATTEGTVSKSDDLSSVKNGNDDDASSECGEEDVEGSVTSKGVEDSLSVRGDAGLESSLLDLNGYLAEFEVNANIELKQEIK